MYDDPLEPDEPTTTSTPRYAACEGCNGTCGPACMNDND